ncbi:GLYCOSYLTRANSFERASE [Salix purpurea]|uniref:GLYCOSYLTRANSFERASE n=1 Tax=Salix purpurea TaxID=77065 RepID=A0A9Q0SRP6_SALPP|nr:GLYCOSYLTRANSFERASE [Salix purpurea]
MVVQPSLPSGNLSRTRPHKSHPPIRQGSDTYWCSRHPGYLSLCRPPHVQNFVFLTVCHSLPFQMDMTTGLSPGDDMGAPYASELKRRGSQTLNELIADSAKEGKPVTCVPATVFDIYYYYFNGYGDIFNNCKDISYVIELPGLPPLTSRDIPSFTLPSNTYTVAIQAFQEQLEHLSQETNPKSACQLFRCIGIGTHECH